MTAPSPVNSSRLLPRHVAVIGAAGGLGQGILSVCRAENVAFTAIVRSRPERITGVPGKSRVLVVSSLADQSFRRLKKTATTVDLIRADKTSSPGDRARGQSWKLWWL